VGFSELPVKDACGGGEEIRLLVTHSPAALGPESNRYVDNTRMFQRRLYGSTGSSSR
jgi:hypothetical protein